MKIKKNFLVFVALSFCAGQAAAASRSINDIPEATPKGITLEALGKAQGYGLDKTTAATVERSKIVFATTKGLTLYTSDADTIGKSACVDACTKTWIPALAISGAVPIENWSIITRTDGAKQWAFKGKALYSYVEDEDPGSVAGSSPKRFSRGEFSGPRGSISPRVPKDKPVPQGWQVAYFFPMTHSNLPSGFTVSEVSDALGLALVDTNNRTVYSAPTTPKACKTDPCTWEPVPAPSAAEARGDFAPIWRNDGVRQWTYKGLPLFTFAGDLIPGEANGVGVEKGFAPVRIVKYFTPANVSLQDNPKLGKVFATAQGLTLYMRDAYIFQSGSGHSLRHGSPIRPAVGRDLGTNPRCKDDCQKSWHPFLAPDDAQANGNWNVYVRDDGKKQWAYQGYALWTFDGDKKPGDINGNDDYQIAMSHDARKELDIGTPYDGPSALYWIAAHP